MSGLDWIYLGIGVVLGYGMSVGYRTFARRSPIGSRPVLQKTIAGIQDPDLLPIAIMAAINQSPVMQQAQVAKSYQGVSVSWQVTFESAINTGPFTVRLMCQDRGTYPWVICEVHRSAYPQLQGLLPHTAFWVSGRIASIHGDEIFLRNSTLSFDN